MTRILAIDTSVGPCSIALWQDGGVTTSISEEKLGMQSKLLLPMMQELLKNNRMNYNDLSAIACTVGPGGFTGLRIGLSAASAVAYAVKLKPMGFTTLQTLAYGVWMQKDSKAKHILTLLNAGKGEVYYQFFASDNRLEPLATPQTAKLSDILADMPEATYIAGNVELPKGYDVCAQHIPDAASLAALAASNIFEPVPLMPFYLRAPDAKLPALKTT